MILEQPHIGNQFIALKKVSELTALLKISDFEFLRMVENPVYHAFEIGRKNGPGRQILAPSPDLKIRQKYLSRILQKVYYYYRPACVHGFIRKFNDQKGSVVTNAQPHVNKRYVLSMDIRDFFPSVTAPMVQEMLMQKLKLPLQVAAALTRLCTYQERLPQGAPTSPIISNFIFLDLDHALQDFSSYFSITYTRYADDLTFSTNEEAFRQTALTTFKTEVEKKILKAGFVLHPQKIVLRTSLQRQQICGIKVNEKLNISRAYKKQTRAMRHDLEVNGLEKAAAAYFAKWRPGEKADSKKFLEILRGRESWGRSL